MCQCDDTSSHPPTHQLLQTISLLARCSTSGSDWGIAHFFIATRNKNKGVEGKKTNEQTNNMLGLTQVQKGSYVTLHSLCVYVD